MKTYGAGLTVTAWAGLVIAGMAEAADIRSLVVTEDDGRYFLESDTHFEASGDALFHVLIDYDNFDRISSAFKESRYLEPDADGTERVYTKARGCILFFCKTLERVERLEYTRNSKIQTTIVPEESDLKYGITRWELKEDGDGTSILYSIEMEPDFWVPPVIGPPMIKRTLRNKGEDALKRIELLALDHAGEQDAAASR